MDWHRLFGLVLTDFFTGSPFAVELEKDLSLKQQFLDVVIVRKGKGRFRRRLPDGLEELADHNLITFKSHHEALDDWALMELTGHFVNYRKQVSPARRPLLPLEAFRLYAVCSSYPHNLANEVRLEPVQAGVYDCRRGTNVIRVMVGGQLPPEPHNAPLHLFSASKAGVAYGARHYPQCSPDTSTVLQQLFRGYGREGVIMPYTMQDFRKDYAKEHFKDLTLEDQREVLAGLPAASRQAILAGFPATDRRALLAGLPVEDILQLLPRKDIEKFLKRRK
jgi:hypothetical protein